MAHKAIKTKYDIKHIVTQKEDNIFIGSPYISDIIVINSEGKIIKRHTGNSNDELTRYQHEMDIDEQSGELKRLFHLTDTFECDLPVFTYRHGRIIRQYCEQYGYPNVTHCGQLMYENTHYKTYDEAYKELLKDTLLKYDFRNWAERMSEYRERIFKQNSILFKYIRYYLYARTIQRIVGYFKYKLP